MSIVQQYRQLIVTTPINTQKTAPLTTQTGLTNVRLNRIELRIPPGHGGLTGISIQWAGVSIVPFVMPVQYIVGDDDLLEYDVGQDIGGGLTVVTYNTDIGNAHSHHLRFAVTPFSLSTPAPAVTPVPISAL